MSAPDDRRGRTDGLDADSPHVGNPDPDNTGEPYEADGEFDSSDGGQWTEPTPEQIEARARRADKATRGALAGILALEALVVLLVPRAIAFTTGLGTTRTVICIALAVVLVFVAGLLRRPWGIAVGSSMQVLFTATGIMITTMFVVGVIFAVIWLRLLMLRHEVVGSPGGLRLLAG